VCLAKIELSLAFLTLRGSGLYEAKSANYKQCMFSECVVLVYIWQREVD